MEKRSQTDPTKGVHTGEDPVAAWISEQAKQEAERGGTTPAASDSTRIEEEILRWIRCEERSGPR